VTPARSSDRTARRNSVTPSGIEAGPNVTGNRRVTPAPTGPAALARLEAAARCNECNEALDMARRLAFVAQSALRNGDPQRACSVLQDLLAAISSYDSGELATAHTRR
jgi:hypothetical protein